MNENNELEISASSGSAGGDEFFSKLIELSDYLDSFEIELDEDDEDDDWEDEDDKDYDDDDWDEE